MHKKRSSCQPFIKLYEQYLAYPDLQKLLLPNFKVWVRYYLSIILGSFGLCLDYLLRVISAEKVTLTVIDSVAIIDIKAGLILNAHGMNRQFSHLRLSRLHLPSLKIMFELINAYQRYTRLKSIYHKKNIISTENRGKKDSLIAAGNPNYLIWLVDYFFYRSALVANKSLISSKIYGVVTIDEFTPSNCGILSVFYEIQKPLILYLPFSSGLNIDLALPVFNVVLARNGIDADAVKTKKFDNIFLLDNVFTPIYTATKDILNVAIFLASFYNLDINKLQHLVETQIIPFIQNIQAIWRPALLLIFCHPNDQRVSSLLAQYGIHVRTPSGSIHDKLMHVDLVVCGNTSVAEEALIRGIPVAYSSKLDAYIHDFYGYVEKGLVLDISDTVPMVPEIMSFYEQKSIRQNIKSHFCGHLSHSSITLEKLLIAAAQKEEWINS